MCRTQFWECVCSFIISISGGFELNEAERDVCYQTMTDESFKKGVKYLFVNVYSVGVLVVYNKSINN